MNPFDLQKLGEYGIDDEPRHSAKLPELGNFTKAYSTKAIVNTFEEERLRLLAERNAARAEADAARLKMNEIQAVAALLFSRYEIRVSSDTTIHAESAPEAVKKLVDYARHLQRVLDATLYEVFMGVGSAHSEMRVKAGEGLPEVSNYLRIPGPNFLRSDSLGRTK